MSAPRFIACLMAFIFSVSLAAKTEDFPTTQYDPSVPTLLEVIGHDHGQAITKSLDISTYMQALAKHDPKRIKVFEYGQTWQGRPLEYAVISSASNISRLNEFKQTLAQLGKGQELSSETLDDLPGVAWLAYGVHGNEITPSDSALFLMYHLLAAQNDALSERILDELIVIIDPNQNPDGRERFLFHFDSASGLKALSDRYTAEHDEPWPGGRFNHYIFDLNRDWFALTQPETQGKVQALNEWQPLVFVDSHEMGGDMSYFFPPPAAPFNPNITDTQRTQQTLLGQTMANWFDRYGEAYFTREIFDAFYPGYGDMWPTLNGAIGMTFEQGSPRGMLYERKDGSILTFKQGVRNNVLSSMGTLEALAKNKASFIKNYQAYRQSAIAQARKSDDRFFIMDLSKRRYEAEQLARRLVSQGIEALRLPQGAEICRKEYKDGAIVVDTAQGQARLINSLLDISTPLSDSFIKKQEARRSRGLEHELYDVTAWSMPLMDGVVSARCKRAELSDAVVITADEPINAKVAESGQYGYIIPWSDSGQAKLVIEALKIGLVGKTSEKAFTQNGREFGRGSVVFTQADNKDLSTTLSALANKVGAEIVAMQSSWVDKGPNVGSQAFATLKMPKVAMAWDESTNASLTGNTRFVLERQLGIPVAPIRVTTMSYAKLSKYDVLIIPEVYGNFSMRLGSPQVIKEFVNKGGVLISMGSSTALLASKDFALLSTKRELAVGNDVDDKKAEKNDQSFVAAKVFEDKQAYKNFVQDPNKRPDRVPGALVNTLANTDHWLSSGYTNATALVSGRNIFRPLNAADGHNVMYFDSEENLLLSGYLWAENKKQLAYKPFVMAQAHGEGLVIAFTYSPTLRAYLNGLNLLMANSVVLAPARIH